MAEVRPVRLRLSRAKGFDLQLLSRSTNGLPAKSVARPGFWGNPFTHRNRSVAVRAYRSWLVGTFRTTELYECSCRWGKSSLRAIRHDSRNRLSELRGHNLACWCPLPALGEPDHCHAAVLLDILAWSPPVEQGAA